MTIDELIALFQEHLYLPDPAPVELMLATLVASRMPGKQPVWILLVGPPSSGKTVLFDAIAGEDDVEVVSTVTEAGLLSGSVSRSEESTGGLLAKIGAEGLLCIKDFTSILSATAQDRSKLLAAFREIHDGVWVRHLGSRGGVSIGWRGRICLIGAVTEVIDLHTAAIGAMGERFLYYRLPALDEDERMELDAAAAVNAHREQEVHDLLADASGRFLAGLKPPGELEPLSDDADLSLGRICDLATRCRTPLHRDERGKVILVPEPEATPRLHGMIYILLQALLALGVREEECWRLAHEVALGSIPKTRRHVIDLLATSNTELHVTDVAADLAISKDAAYKVAEELAALGVAVQCATSTVIRASQWLQTRWAETHVESYIRVRRRADDRWSDGT